MKVNRLTDKQDRFCEEFILDLNGTQSAIRAGFSQATAGSIAFELLKKPEIQDRIAELKAERSKRTAIDAEKVVAELAKLGFYNIKNYYKGGRLKALEDLTDEEAAAIQEVKTKEFFIGDEGGKIVETVFKMQPKIPALEALGKHTGIYEKDNKQKAQAQVVIMLPDNGRD